MDAKFPPLLGQLLWPALTDQAKTKEVDEREFRRSINGDVLSAARDILLEEIVNFSPKHRRTVAAAVLQKQRVVEEAAAELALTKLADPELQAQVMEALETSLATEMRAAVAKLKSASETESSPAVASRRSAWIPRTRPYTWRRLSRLAAGRYEPFAVLAQVWAGSKRPRLTTSTPTSSTSGKRQYRAGRR